METSNKKDGQNSTLPQSCTLLLVFGVALLAGGRSGWLSFTFVFQFAAREHQSLLCGYYVKNTTV